MKKAKATRSMFGGFYVLDNPSVRYETLPEAVEYARKISIARGAGMEVGSGSSLLIAEVVARVTCMHYPPVITTEKVQS